MGLDDRHAAVVYSAASGLAPPGAAFLFSGDYNAFGVSPSCGVAVMAGAAFLFAASCGQDFRNPKNALLDRGR